MTMLGTDTHLAYLGLGSNIDPSRNLERAYVLLGQQVEILGVSSAWETPAVGESLTGEPSPKFINAALAARVRFTATDLVRRVLRPIESGLGRVRTADRNAPRPIDIDILVYDCECLDPEVWEHAHLAIPLAELIPEYTNPASGETLAQAARRLMQTTPIQPCPEVMKGAWGSHR